MSAWRLLSPNQGAGALLAVVSLLVLAGCGSGGYSGPTGTVSGTVTLKGEAVPQGCGVTFVSPQGFTAHGDVGSGGSYQLSTVGKDGQRSDKIPVGTYNVAVSDPPQPETSQEDYDKMMEAAASGQATTEAAPEVIPAEYHSTGTSGLSFEVKEGANTIDLQLGN